MLDEFDIGNLFYGYGEDEIYEELKDELDKISTELRSDGFLGSLSLGIDKISLFGSESDLDEIRCKIHPASVRKNFGNDKYEVIKSHLNCDLITGKGGKEIWVSAVSDSRNLLKNQRGRTRFFDAEETANAEREIQLKDGERNEQIRKIFDMMRRYARDYSEIYEHRPKVKLTLKIDGNKEEGKRILQ